MSGRCPNAVPARDVPTSGGADGYVCSSCGVYCSHPEDHEGCGYKKGDTK